MDDAISRGGARTRREDADIARLKEELRARQQQLVAETTRNARAKVQVELFNALILASEAMGALVMLEAASSTSPGTCGCGGAGACAAHAEQQRQEQDERTRAALQALETQLDVLVRSIDRGSSSSGGGGAAGSRGGGPPYAAASSGERDQECSVSGCSMDASSQMSGTHAPGDGGLPDCGSPSRGSSSSSRTAATLGLLGLTASDFLREIVGGRALVGSKEEFIAYWRQRVMSLALLAHQYRSGAATRGMVEKFIYEMGVRFGALFVYGSYVLEVIVLDLETGLVCEAPQSLWDRVAAALSLNPEQALAFGTLHRWWQSSTRTFQRERAQLTQAALASPTDLQLQDEVVEGLERVNRGYLSAAVAVLAVTMFGVTRPEQVTASWITCWPRMPLMTAIFDALERRRSV